MADPAWTAAEVAHALCDSLVAAGKLRSSPVRTSSLAAGSFCLGAALRPASALDVPPQQQAFIREDREAKIAGIFE